MPIRESLKHIYEWQRRKWFSISRAKADRLIACLRKTYPPQTVLFYPSRPLPYTAIYKFCHLGNCRITADRSSTVARAVYWEDKTFRRPGTVIAQLNAGGRLINGQCVDISKTKVATIFEQTFGYPLAIDPTTFEGPAVCKSDANASHNGRVINCPIQDTEPGFVYQVIVNNTVEDEVEDIRIAVMKDVLPLAYVKRRPKSDRFSNTNTSASVQAVGTLLSVDEMNRLLVFCRAIGLDYGEIDTLRDRDSGRLYVVDVNSTPFGPPNHLPKQEGRRAMKLLAESFRQQFFGD